jgi:hypothetical protein
MIGTIPFLPPTPAWRAIRDTNPSQLRSSRGRRRPPPSARARPKPPSGCSRSRSASGRSCLRRLALTTAAWSGRRCSPSSPKRGQPSRRQPKSNTVWRICHAPNINLMSTVSSLRNGAPSLRAAAVIAQTNAKMLARRAKTNQWCMDESSRSSPTSAVSAFSNEGPSAGFGVIRLAIFRPRKSGHSWDFVQEFASSQRRNDGYHKLLWMR